MNSPPDPGNEVFAFVHVSLAWAHARIYLKVVCALIFLSQRARLRIKTK